MRNLNLFGLIFLLLMGSCIYEDGPRMSFRSKKARAVNIWYIDKVFEDGADKTENYKNAFVNYRLELKQDDNYDLSYRPYNVGTYNEKGTWKFSSDKSEIILTPVNTTQENKFKLLRLKHSEMWVQEVSNGKTIEYQLKD